MSPGIKLGADIALQTVLIALFLGSLFSLAVGVSLMLGNRWVFRLNDYMKRWVSTREAMRPMDVQRSIEAHVYRCHWAIGLAIALGAAFVLYFELFNFNAKAVASLFQPRGLVWIESLVQMGWWIGLVGTVAGLIVGMLLMAKPALLRAADSWANRNYSGRRATKPLEAMNFSPDQWIAASPKLSGGIIAVGSVYAAVVLGFLLLAGHY